MCDPVTMAMVAAAATNFVIDRQSTQAQNKFGKQREAQAQDLALRSAYQRYGDLRTRQDQETKAAALDIDRVSREALAAAGTARVSAAESGVAGQSVQSVIQDFARQELDFQTGTLQNLKFSNAATEQAAKNVRMQTEGRLLDAQFMPVPVPSFLQGALQIGTAGLQGKAMNTTTGPDGTSVNKIDWGDLNPF